MMNLKSFKTQLEWFFGFDFKLISSFENVVQLMHEPRDPTNLGLMRILFGVLMITDTLFERKGLYIMNRWGSSRDCHFPLFSQMQIPNFFIMAFIYSIMMTGAVGITLGYKFKYTSIMFIIPYWYLLVLDKTYWNNHSYLFGLVSILLSRSSANVALSLDSLCDQNINIKTVPFWNYFILRFQFFVLYFIAGLKKIDMEWLAGHSMTNISHHWIFEPFKFFLASEQIDYLVVHLGGFFIDLTLGFWLISPIARPYAMLFGAAFHFMNSQLFSIGVFPYVCITTMPIFCVDDWPKRLLFRHDKKNNSDQHKKPLSGTVSLKHRCVTILLLIYCGLQLFLPYSHIITKGYNNWTNGLYGYSWDMMIHSWNSALVVIRVVDNGNAKEYFIDPEIWTQNQRWNKHADMCLQYARCLKQNLIRLNGSSVDSKETWPILSKNISIYIDVWCSLNGRFQQRMFDPNYDLLNANWSPFEKVEWLLPLMSENGEFRKKLQIIENQVYSWSNYSDVMFVADFPGMNLENYLSVDLVNVTLTVLGGEVIYETEAEKSATVINLSSGSSCNIDTGRFHKIYTNGEQPSLYMYTFVNQTKAKLENKF